MSNIPGDRPPESDRSASELRPFDRELEGEPDATGEDMGSDETVEADRIAARPETENVRSPSNHPADDLAAEPSRPRRSILLFGRRMPLPASRGWRIALGVALVLGGVFSFLPILGVWMFPLGFLVLSVDFAFVRRWRRRIGSRWGRWRRKRRLAKSSKSN